MIRYAIFVNGEKTQEGVLAPGEHVAGRSRSVDVRLAEPDISGKHLKLAVAPDGVYAENLSSHGTLLRGAALTGRRELRNGDVLTLGKHTEFRIEIPEQAESSDADGEQKTVIPGTPPAGTPAPGDDRTEIPAGAEKATPEAENGALPENPPPDESVLQTDVMHTRLASLEEMNLLRHADRKRSTGKLFKTILGGVGALVLLIVLYSLKASPEEENLTWPVDAAGKALGAFADPGNGGHHSGGFSLSFPSLEGRTTVDRQQGRIVVNTRCGSDGSVPLRIVFLQKQADDFLTRDRQEVFADLLGELQQQNRHWNLAQISDVFFIGAENGLPCLSVEYRREEDGKSWYGEALFFRTGDRAFLRLAEVPAEERARAQNFISNTPFLKFSLVYLHGHWEGNGEYGFDGNVDVMLDEVSRHLSKQAPFEWARTYLLLQNVLMESTRTRNQALETEALMQLRRLRAMQTVWYNAQKIQYDTAKLYHDQRQENAIMELSRTVFSSPDDLRYFTLRRNLWD